MKHTCLSMFSGGGLADVGLRATGFEPVAAVEYDERIAEVYAANHGDHVQVARVEDVDYRPFAGVSLLWASPACTRASVANQNGGEALEDRSAGEAVARCLREVRPRWFVLENVFAYRCFDAFTTILSTLRELGYAVEWSHRCAASWGVPQTRRRLILRACRTASVPPLTATHYKGGQSGGLFEEEGLLPWVGWYAAVEDLLPSCPESRLANWQLARLPMELLESLLIERLGARNGPLVTRSPVDPMWTVRAVERADECANALLIGQQYDRPQGDPNRQPQTCAVGQPAMPVTASLHGKGKMPRALLIDGQQISGPGSGGAPMHRDGNAPAYTICGTSYNGGGPRALLVDSAGYPGADGVTVPVTRNPAQPANVIVANFERRPMRAPLGCGRVVSMTPRCPARFQACPNTYILPEKAGLATKIIGNGVPPLWAEAIGRSLLP